MKFFKQYISLIKLFSGIVLSFSHVFLFGRSTNYQIKHYTSDNGLPQNSVSGLRFDKDGFLWVSTQGGMCCFDGQGFRKFDIENTPALKSNRFYSIYKKQNGNLGFLDDLWNFYSISRPFKISIDNATPEVFFVDGRTFFGYGKLLRHANWPLIHQGDSTSHALVQARYIVNAHECYAQINNKLYFLDNQYNIVEYLGIETMNTNDIPPGIFVDGAYIYYEKERINIFRHGKPQHNITLTTEASSLMKRIFRYTAKVLNHSLVFVDKNICTMGLRNDTITVSLLAKNIALNDTEVDFGLYDSLNDKICLGSIINGMFILSKESIGTLQNGNFYDVLSLGNGNFLNNLAKFNIHTKQDWPLSVQAVRTTMYRAKDGYVWCESGSMLCRTKEDPIDFQPIQKVNRIVNTQVCFCEDEKSNFWASFDNCIWSIKDGKVTWLADIGMAITLIFHFDDHLLWLFTKNGILEYSIQKNTIAAAPIATKLPIRSIYRARDGSIWIGTYGRGMYKYQNGKFTPLPLDDHASLQNAHNFFEDKMGFFWIPTNDGLIQCLKSDLDSYINNPKLAPFYYRYDQTDGLVTNEFNGGAQSPYALSGDSGEIVYPSIKGAVFFSPFSMNPRIGTFELFIESATIDNKQANLSKAIEISPSFAQMKVQIGYPFFGNQENLKIEYNIQGLNNEWYRIGSNKMVILNRLPHGYYELVIRKKNGFGINNYTYKRLGFTVRPMPYETWWFYVLCSLLVIITSAVLYKLKHRSETRTRLLLEHEVSARTQDLDDAVQQLNTTVSQLYESESNLSEANDMKERVIAIILHDIKAPLRYLSIAASGFRKDVGNMDRQELDEFSAMFAEQTLRTNHFVDNLLQWLLSQKQASFKPTLSTFSINSLCEEVKLVYEEIAKLRGNVIKIQLTTEKKISTDRNILKLILQNLIDNSIKNTTDGVIELSVQKLEKTICLQIKDNGKGMNETELEKANRPVEEEQNINGNLGLGLVKTFLKLISGSMIINSDKGHGTSVLLFLPV